MVVDVKKWISKCCGKVVNIAFGICIAIIVLLMLQLFVITSFKIPSDSMEPALLPGDYILVDKCSKGARLFNVFASLEGKNVAIYRMPGWRQFKRNDVLVFNYPYSKRKDSIALDVMTYYVKRCVALPGDTLEIRNAHYRVRNCSLPLGNQAGQDFLREMIDSGKAKERRIALRSYPKNKLLNWNIGEFGPFYIPVKGSRVDMTPLNKVLYRNVIEWEQGKKLTVRGDTVLLGDSIIHSYQFGENYYFVSGDKIENSLDSRYWGLLPESFIVGRAWRVWKSIDRDEDTLRWNRIFKRIE